MRSNRISLKNKHQSSRQTRSEMDPRKREELLGAMLITLGVLTAIALFTYYPDEHPGPDLQVGEVVNRLGIVGVYISHFLINWTIGYPVFFLPFFIIAWGVNRLLGKDTHQLNRWTLFTVLISYFVSVSGALHSFFFESNRQIVTRFSGLLGGLGAEFLRKFFGPYGAVVVLIGLIMVTIILFTKTTFAEVYQIASTYLSRFLLRFSKLWQEIVADISRRRGRKPLFSMKGSDNASITDSVLPGNEPAIMDTVDEPRSFPKIKPKSAAQEQLDLSLEDEDPSAAAMPEISRQQSGPYKMPPFDLLQLPERPEVPIGESELRGNAKLLEEKLSDFDISSKVTEIHPGPVITRYEIELAPGIKVSRITSLADDLAMAMRAKRIRIVAPIPGKAAIGVEIPNSSASMVYLREILSAPLFQQAKSPLTLGLGKTISGAPYVADLTTMPHLLIAGSTGSGKSVCLNTIIASILYKAKPSEVQFVLIDPKRLELSAYSGLHHHHLTYVEGMKEKVATSAKSATVVLKSVEQEMERRYELLAGAGVRNIEEYNQRVQDGRVVSYDGMAAQSLCYLVLIIDELADLMLTAGATRDVEEPIARLTQMSRAVGIHLILATQRPSVDVITGVIKANFPARIAFQVASKVDSRTILDMNGADKLLGRGDMLFLPPASPEPIRLHNAFISLNEIERIISHISGQAPHDKAPLPAFVDEEAGERVGYDGGKRDALFNDALKLVVRTQQGSVSLLQRRLKVGYSRAARLIDELEDAGIVGPFEGSKAREVLMTPEELESYAFDSEEE
jgi:S-DNA-T family DNA segregation ATPase FtsK/SpoIIIE